MLLTIWERYFLAEICKGTLFFIFGFYGLYVLIDYASHAATFHHQHVSFQWREMGQYYSWEFVRRLEVLLPFGLLISTIRTLCRLNVHHELVALMSSGVSLRRLMRPFVCLGLFCTLFIYFNTEYILPDALGGLRKIDHQRSLHRHKGQVPDSVQHIILEDGSVLIFQNFDEENELFYDAFWIRNLDEIYRLKYLAPYAGVPLGYYVDQLKRTNTGELIVAESTLTKAFPEMQFNKTTLFETITPPEELSFRELYGKIPSGLSSTNEKEAQLQSTYFMKMIMPWLCLLAVIGPAPACLRITRNLPIFFIYTWSIVALIAFYLILGAAGLLGKRQVLPPIWSIGIPFLLFSGVLLMRFWTNINGRSAQN